MKVLVITILATVLLNAIPVYGFELPGYDPWYYHSLDQGYTFWIPDKAQHYWGSVLMNEIGKRLPLPAAKTTSPILVFSAGFMYEVWQDRKGIGFSERDMVANALGVLTSKFSTPTFKMWMDYSTKNRVIIFNVGKMFWG
jgi:hypothetical protein